MTLDVVTLSYVMTLSNDWARMLNFTQLQFSGPIKLGGVGNITTESSCVYSITLPTYDG